MKKFLAHLEVPALMATPLLLLASIFFPVAQTGALTLVVVSATVLLFFVNFEVSRPALRQIMPTVVLGSLAAAGRILFAAVPSFKPVSAIAILAGVVFGKRVGFMVGALAALVSNFFFGQGPWTPWQMYAWGIVGYIAGVASEHDWFEHRWVLLVYGFFSAALFSVMLNTYYAVSFIQPLTWQSAMLAYGASLPFDITHGVATVIFLGLIYVPWSAKLQRIKRKYQLAT
ncbi:MAG: ECF transporter S component [Actinomycetia bacterium]|nr:ECF transporter S component [Actinomycetes bacterium]